jgi:hypothetical protein
MKRFSIRWTVTVVCVTLAMAILSWRYVPSDKLASSRGEIATECSAATLYYCLDSQGLNTVEQACSDYCRTHYQSDDAAYSVCKVGCTAYKTFTTTKGKKVAQ